MKPTETPVFRPTADCIWNSFRSSNKRHLILTGGRKSGKTTLLNALFPAPLPGLTTRAEPKKAVYLTENLSGHTTRIGVFNPSLPGPENRMDVCREGFLSLGIPALRRCLQAESEWITIDEIGYLETGCAKYQNAIRSLMDAKRVAAVVRKQDLPFLREICGREDAFVVDLDAPYGSAGCVIMASGLGHRFGGNKLMADFRGKPLICRALEATEGIFARRVVVTRHAEIADLCRSLGVEVVLHDLPMRSDTVRLGIEAIGDADACLFCPGDQPLLRRETVAALALSAVNGKNFIWRTAFEGEPGSPVLFPEWAFPQLHTLPEGKGGGYIAKKHPELVRTVPVRDKYELMDADTPEDLFVLSQH